MTKWFVLVGALLVAAGVALMAIGGASEAVGMNVLGMVCALPVGWSLLMFAAGRASNSYKLVPADDYSRMGQRQARQGAQ